MKNFETIEDLKKQIDLLKTLGESLDIRSHFEIPNLRLDFVKQLAKEYDVSIKRPSPGIPKYWITIGFKGGFITIETEIFIPETI